MLAMSVVLAVAIAWGFYIGVQNRRYVDDIARIDRNRAADAALHRRQLEDFLRDTCTHGAERGEVIVTVLRDARKRALARGDLDLAHKYATAIDDLRAVNERCFATVPTTPTTPP